MASSLRAALPQHHLNADSKDVVKLGIGLVGTMAALVLGLLVASAKGSYDTQSTELTEMSAKIVLLDRFLTHYGPETKETRDLLRGAVVRILDRTWSKDSTSPSESEPPSIGNEAIYDKIQGLSPKDDTQRSLQAQALSIVIGLGETRWLMYTQSTTSVSLPLLVVMVFWLSIIFISFGLFAPPNATVVASLFRLRVVGIGRNLPDPRNVHALRGADSDLQRPAACRPRTSRPIACQTLQALCTVIQLSLFESGS